MCTRLELRCTQRWCPQNSVLHVQSILFNQRTQFPSRQQYFIPDWSDGRNQWYCSRRDFRSSINCTLGKLCLTLKEFTVTCNGRCDIWWKLFALLPRWPAISNIPQSTAHTYSPTLIVTGELCTVHRHDISFQAFRLRCWTALHWRCSQFANAAFPCLEQCGAWSTWCFATWRLADAIFCRSAFHLLDSHAVCT